MKRRGTALIASLMLGAGSAAAQSPFELRNAVQNAANTVSPAETALSFHLGMQQGTLRFAQVHGLCRGFNLYLTGGERWFGRLCRLPYVPGWRLQTFLRADILERSPGRGFGPAPRAPADRLPSAGVPYAYRPPDAKPAAPPPPPPSLPEPSPRDAPPPAYEPPHPDRRQGTRTIAPTSASPPATAPSSQREPAHRPQRPPHPVLALQQQLQKMPIRYKKPESLSMDADTPVALIIEGLGAGSGAEAFRNLAGKEVEGVAPLTPKVTAKLSGPTDEVTIEAESAATQEVSRLSNTSWVWQVRGRKPGYTTLSLELDANVMIDGQLTPLQVTTYNDRFPVRIGNLVDELVYWINQIKPIYAFLGLAPPAVLIGAAWAFWRKRR